MSLIKKSSINSNKKTPNDKTPAGSYNIFHPHLNGFLLGMIDKDLNVLPVNRELHGAALSEHTIELIISQIERGIAKKTVLSWLVAPALGNPKEDACYTLGKFVKKHNRIEYQQKKSGNRYTAKVDWLSDKVKNQVQDLLNKHQSLSSIARYLGVSRSTLTKANKRHHYRLYIPKLC